MKKYLVSLDISSQELSLEELSGIIPLKPDKSSCSKGDRFLKLRAKRTLWLIKSKQRETALIENHVRSMIPIFNVIKKVRHKLPTDNEVTLSIGIFFNKPMACFVIPQSVTKLVNSIDAKIEVSAYPIWDKK